MFAPFKVLTVRAGHRAQVIALASPPVVTDVPNLNYDRIWGNATLLPDGEILVTGGSGVVDGLTNVAYQAEIFNPYFRHFWNLETSGASAAIPPSLSFIGAAPSGRVGADRRRWGARPG